MQREVWLVQGSQGDQVYADKHLVITRTSSPVGLSFAGAIDYFNADAVATVLGDELRADGDGPSALSNAITGDGHALHLDLTLLEFSDVTGIRALVSVAESASGGRQLILHGLPPSIVNVITVVGWADLPNLVIDGSR